MTLPSFGRDLGHIPIPSDDDEENDGSASATSVGVVSENSEQESSETSVSTTAPAINGNGQVLIHGQGREEEEEEAELAPLRATLTGTSLTVKRGHMRYGSDSCHFVVRNTMVHALVAMCAHFQDPVEMLPYEICMLIFSFLSTQDLCSGFFFQDEDS